MFSRKSKDILGTVLKKSSDKTVSVACTHFVVFSKYKKKVLKTRKFLVHDENNECVVGDKVLFYFTAPISKTKNSVIHKKVV